jgi:hypothetical protein
MTDPIQLVALMMIPLIPSISPAIGAVTNAIGHIAFINDGTLTIIGWALVGWSLVWKGLALWVSARLKQKWWFMPLVFINTLGILEILYLFVFSADNSKKSDGGTPARPSSPSVV